MNALSPFPDSPYNTPYKIVRIYLKGASSEVPDMATVPRQAISPHVGVDMQTLATPAWPGALECVLRITLHARLEGKTVFMIEVSEAGVFELDISDMEEAHRFVRKVAPSVLFPFARKDLASLAVAAGFQPVLLDHIDFDSMLAQVMKSQRLTRSAAPMRLDVIAAKPVAQAAPTAIPTAIPADTPASAPLPTPVPIAVPIAVLQANEDKAGPAWSDTQPAALPTLPPTAHAAPRTPQRAGADEERGKTFMVPAKPKLRNMALAAVCVAGVGAMVAWWAQPRPPVTNDAAITSNSNANVITKAPAATASQAALPDTSSAPPTPAVPVASANTLRAIDLSRERLADQPASWFTLDLGLGPADMPLAAWYPAVADRPMFVQPAKDGSIRLLYGVFPSRAAAEQVKSDMKHPATVVTIGSL